MFIIPISDDKNSWCRCFRELFWFFPGAHLFKNISFFLRVYTAVGQLCFRTSLEGLYMHEKPVLISIYDYKQLMYNHFT